MKTPRIKSGSTSGSDMVSALIEAASRAASRAAPSIEEYVGILLARPSKALLRAIERGEFYSISLRGMSEENASELVGKLNATYPGLSFSHTSGRFARNGKRFLTIYALSE